MVKFVLVFASISGAIAVGFGAFGAHALKARLEASAHLATYQTAVQYQFYHTLALLAIGLLMMKFTSQWLVYSGYLMMAGLTVFSGSLYILSLTNIRWLGAITPLGGLGLIVGWVCLTIALFKLQL